MWFRRCVEGIFGHLNSRQWVYIASIVVALAINLATLSYSGAISKVSYAVFILTVTATFLLDRIERYQFENEAMAELKKFARTDLDLQHLGGVLQGVEWFRQHSNGLSTVKNTVFSRYSVIPDQYFTEVEMPNYEKQVAQIINRQSCYWMDLAMENQRSVVDRFRARVSPKAKGKYVPRVIKGDIRIPLMQVLIGRKDSVRGRSEAFVLFGWAFQGGSRAEIYVSTGAETVQYFEGYFDKLWADADDLRPSPPQSLSTSGVDQPSPTEPRLG